MLFTGRKLDENTFVEYCVDISERKRAELAAQRSEERRKKLIRDLAHGLNNPLQAASCALYLLRPEMPQNAAAKALQEALKKIESLSHSLIDAVASESHSAESEGRPPRSADGLGEKKHGT